MVRQALAAGQIAWADLIEAEPGLELLRRQAAAWRDGDGGGNVWPAWRAFKRRLAALVGWDRRHGPAALQTSAAFELAAGVIVAALEGTARASGGYRWEGET